ncbi:MULTISPECIES: KTSC domain-containing protein [unclassified Mesorhizobium]|uniref:KTSC domain-containing protein n=1 Tax=unclassified Mesorhizobium TaxID=325217 RepID=UPI0003CF1B2E|nr:KTSC domain-containing protein [Mesorhizobium sp. LSHC420B00]ESX80681.1 hypothetical protein X759_12180 [Mesorhizobium sp. LSHC420B00]
MAFRDFAPFTSSSIQALRYDEGTQVLQVLFNNGGVYEYYGVPARMAEEFERSESKGVFLAANLKGHYRYSRV